MKLIKRSFVVLLSIILVFSLIPSFSALTPKEPVSYEFANDMAGYAEGIISLNEETTNTYKMYWADDESALDGYYPIGEISNGKPYEFLENIAIPVGATKLILVSGESLLVSDADYVYDVPENKQNRATVSNVDAEYSFVQLSDTQLDRQSSPFYTYGEEHYAMALEDAAQRDVDFITISGDCINNYEGGTSKEWLVYQKILAESSFTGHVYETNGNHSMKSDIQYGIPAYISATGQNTGVETLGDEPWYEMTAPNGDHFLFVSLETESDVGGYDQFSTKQMDWLEETIAKYYEDGKHIFIFEHAFFHGYGPGEDKELHPYNGGLRTTSAFPNNKRFKQICDKYNEVFLYTGHSHIDFSYNWNYDNENGQGCNMFHTPATACTTKVTTAGTMDYTMNYNASQCYLIDTYSDQVISYGLNVVDNKIYPQYSYIVDTIDYKHVPVTPEPVDPTQESETMMEVQVVDNTDTAFLFTAGAKLYFYNHASGNKYEVNDVTHIAMVPDNSTDLVLYRCNGEWGMGDKTDDVTTYWNRFGWEDVSRSGSQNIFTVSSSSAFKWSEGEIVIPTEPETEEPTEEPEPSEIPEDITIYLNDKTSSSWVFGSGAKMFLYDKETEEHYAFEAGDPPRVTIPYTSGNYVIYRCNGAWGVGNRTDEVTSYWNKWDIPKRTGDNNCINITSDKATNWSVNEGGGGGLDPNARYYIVGYFDGQDYTGRDYEITSGKCHIDFSGDSYVNIITDKGTSYWTDGWQGYETTTCTLYKATMVSVTNKLFVPAGSVDFTLELNQEEGTVTISYECTVIELDITELDVVPTVWGDADQSGELSVIDATAVQTHLSGKKDLSYEGVVAARVSGDETLSIIDVSRIQMKLAKKIDAFPVEKEESKPDVSTMEKLQEAVNNDLSDDYRYASYNTYADLKKAAKEDAGYDELLSAYNDFEELKSNNNLVTMYFCNDIAMATVKAYITDSETGKAINTLATAQSISKMDTLECGVKIFAVTVNTNIYDSIQFTDGATKKTVTLEVPKKNNMGIYFSGCKTDTTGLLIPKYFMAHPQS